MTIHGEMVINTGKCSEKEVEKGQEYMEQEMIRN